MTLAVLDRDRTIAGPTFNRWLIPPAALAVHLCIGQVYATSVYKSSLVEHFDTSLTAIGFIFSLAIVMLGVSAAVFGTWVDTGGPRRAMAAGTCDAAVVGGVDSLCLTTLYGFNSLQLVSADICRPADPARGGISIGEAAGFALLDPQADAPLALLGYGESSDAYHMSSPDPDGHGAAASMRAALALANVAPREVDYINLHGTGTMTNDSSESRAVCTVFGNETPCSSTKGWTGHTLGAAGIVEAAIAMLCIEHGFMPRSLNTRSKDPAIEAAVLLENRYTPVRKALSNSFGFGGNNCTLLFGRSAHAE